MTTTAAERRRRQETLQAEAESVVDDLGLAALLSQVGEVHRVGSSRLGLMVWRDIDVTVACPRLDEGSVTSVAARLSIRSDVREVLFRKETGRFNLSSHYPDGLYLRLSYRQPERQEWNLDIWFVDEPDRQPDLAHVQSLPARLTDETRDAILLIKDAWARRPEYGSSVSSCDIYTAVLDHGVTTIENYAEWLRSRVGPTG